MIIRNATHPRSYPHSHSYLEILLFLEGRCEYTHNARKYFLSPGTIAICNRGIFHAENFPGSDGRFLTLGITGLSLPGLRKDYLVPPDISPIVDAGVDFPDFCALISVMKHLRKKGTAYSKESVHHLRIGEAQTILTETPLPIADIAYRVGYNSANNFYISFKRITGISPSQYREVYRDANLKMS